MPRGKWSWGRKRRSGTAAVKGSSEAGWHPTWPLPGTCSSRERGLSLQPPSEWDGGMAPGLDLDSPPR